MHRKFVENCRDILAHQSYVSINEAALESFAATLKAQDYIPDWKDYVSAEANSADHYSFKRAFYEFAMVTAQNGGYIYEDAAGVMQKWQKDGSGAKAMVDKMAEIRAAGALPYFDIDAARVESSIAPLLAGVPFAEKRLKIFREFADPQTYKKVEKLLDSAFDGASYKIDMAFVAKLAAALPESFGDDPFMKKAILAPLMASANAIHHGIRVDVSDLTIAADYILPQVLNADAIGVLKFSPALRKTLESRKKLPENSKKVEALRAAAVVVCDRLGAVSGLTAQDIDGSLWLAGRKLKNARPHMMCPTMRF